MLERSRTKAMTIRGMVVQGRSSREIVVATGYVRSLVYKVVSRFRAEGYPSWGRRPMYGLNRVVALRLSYEDWAALEPEASKRNITVAHLAGRLVRAASREALVGALLDDGA